MKAFLFGIVSLFSSALTAQNKDSLRQSKIGIYKTFAEFQSGKPSVTKQFKLDTNYYILNIDTIVEGYNYRFIDSSANLYYPFAMFDGKDVYLYFHNKLKFNIISGFSVMDYPAKQFQKSLGKGKYPFVAIGRTVHISDIGIADAIVSEKSEIWYVNKNGKFLKATSQAIGFLVKDDKDLLKEYEKEKKYNSEVYIKYLQKMNDRYPL